MEYTADKKRYSKMKYRYCGKSGLQLPAISLGMWQNFGSTKPFDNSREMLLHAFDLGITYFDLANNYGPQPGTAEETMGRVLKSDLKSHRDELIISSKAGYEMWDGPYGNYGSRKSLMASLDQSLKRTGLDYFDIFYHHRYDPNTPLEETMSALADIVKQGKALYVGISNYTGKQAQKAFDIMNSLGIHMLIAQPRYSMLCRGIESDLLPVLDENGVGSAAFCPLAQGLLTGKYLNNIPTNSRAAAERTLKTDSIDDETLNKIRALSMIAVERGQTMSQLALSWVLRNNRVTTAIIGASRVEQIDENVGAIDNLDFTEDELNRIEEILGDDKK